MTVGIGHIISEHSNNLLMMSHNGHLTILQPCSIIFTLSNKHQQRTNGYNGTYKEVNKLGEH